MQRRIEHIYFKKDVINDVIEKVVAGKLGYEFVGSVRLSLSFFFVFIKLYFYFQSSDLLHKLATFLYQHANQRIRTRALLCHVYHHALEERFYKARDMLLMSHLQETIQQTDVHMQILYNRTMVQIGTCAFRHGMIKEAQASLQELFVTSKLKELLAQVSFMKDRKKQISTNEYVNRASNRNALAPKRLPSRSSTRSNDSCPSTCTSTLTCSTAFTILAPCASRSPAWPTTSLTRVSVSSADPSASCSTTWSVRPSPVKK